MAQYPQDGPRDAQDGPKSNQNVPKTAPGIAQEGLKMAQRMFISHKVNLRKTSSLLRKVALGAPRWPKIDDKMTPESPKDGSKTARNVP